MNTTEAKTMIAAAMREHGLLDEGWTWKWDRGVRRMGCCHYGPRRLTFSRALFERNTPERCLDTVLHEIAHALVGHSAGHGPRWKAMVASIGGTPRACFTESDTNTVPAKWLGRCGCGREWKRHRLAQNVRHGASCPSCRGGITWTQNRGA